MCVVRVIWGLMDSGRGGWPFIPAVAILGPVVGRKHLQLGIARKFLEYLLLAESRFLFWASGFWVREYWKINLLWVCQGIWAECIQSTQQKHFWRLSNKRVVICANIMLC